MLLDALGTLVALEPPWPALARELRERFGVELALEQAERAMRAEMTYYRAHHDEGRDATTLAELRERCAEVLSGALPPPARELELTSLLEAMLASLRFHAYPDALEALPRLRARGVKLVVASNWDVSLHELLERLGLRALVDGVVTSAEAGAPKPAAPVFEAALELAGATPAQALHVGDSAAADVAGARALGIEVVLIDRGADAGTPQLEGHADHAAGVARITSLTELAPDAP